MEKVIRLNNSQEVRLQTEMWETIDGWLPKKYSKTICRVFNIKKDPSYIRHVKNRKLDSPEITKALLTLALYNKCMHQPVQQKK